MELKGSQTEQNLMRAFAGESQARSRYTKAAEVARKEKMYSVADIFTFTADQEKAHANQYYKLLQPVAPKNIEINAAYPVGEEDDMFKMLLEARHNETEEFEQVYPAFANVAKQEGFVEAASVFSQIAAIEKIHADRFALLADLLSGNKYYESGTEAEWMCTNCGHIHKGLKAPQVCPVCKHVQGFFIPVCLAPYMKECC